MDHIAYIKETLSADYKTIGVLGEGKTLYERKSDGFRLIAATLPEAEAYLRLAGVANTRVARVLDAAPCDGAFLVLTAYVPGQTLAERLRAGEMRKKEIRRIALDLCDALIELHGQGVAHKDLKPENVIIDVNGRATLIDLGIATVFDEARPAKTAALGTVGFAAPEQFGFNRTDARTDLFAFGVVLNLMLTHAHPTVKRYRKGKYGRILKKCLATSPGDRYKNARALKAALLSPW